MPPRLPARAGTYILVMMNPARTALTVGRLGRCDLTRGWYLYTGSAFGPGGLAARAGRHLRPDKPRRWHIDYLTARLPVSRVWLSTAPVTQECQWAEVLLRMGGQTAVPGFGSSDCACAAHLFRFDARPSFVRFRAEAGVPVRSVSVPKDMSA